MREKLRNAVIAACRVWSQDSSCGCYPQCDGCTKLNNAVHDLLEFESKKTAALTTLFGVVDPPESREAMGDDTDFEGDHDGH